MQPKTLRRITMRKFAICFLGVIISLVSVTKVNAGIYLYEDFESYEVGQPLDEGDLWIIHQDANAPGEASEQISFPPGGKSGYLPGMSGIKHIIEAGELPEEFVISVCYYHDSTEDPPPHYMLVFKGLAGNEWLGVGTVETLPNYSVRDKKGTGQETDTGVERKDWINIVWRVYREATDIYLDGEEVYNSTIGGLSWSQPGAFIWFADVWSGASEAYVDSIIIADTLEEATEILAVEPGGKLLTTWAALKDVY
jgi:hypothetical protein